MKAYSDIPGGNAVFLDLREDISPPEIHFAASPEGGPEAAWFYFILDPGVRPQPRLRCVLHFFENLLGNKTGTATAGFHPVFRTSGDEWCRIASVERRATADGQVQVIWEIPGNVGQVEVALSYPYGKAQLDELRSDLTHTVETTSIGLTSANRLIQRLFNHPGSPGSERAGIYCLARQHAGEAPGSWVLDGFLRHLALAGEAAPLVWAVPFVDVDGVYSGLAGKDRFPWDFNRAWGSKLFPEEVKTGMGTHPMRHEVKAIQNDMLRWRTRCRPCLVLDFHAPTICEHDGIYAYLRGLDANGAPDAAQAPWIDACRAGLEPRFQSVRFVRSGRYSGRWNTARAGDFAYAALNLPGIILETPYGRYGSDMFTRNDYQTAGRQIAEAVFRVSRGGASPFT